MNLQLYVSGELVLNVALDACSQVTRVKPDVVSSSCCSLSASWFYIMHVMSCFSAHHDCKERLLWSAPIHAPILLRLCPKELLDN